MSTLSRFLHAIGLGHTDTDSDDDEITHISGIRAAAGAQTVSTRPTEEETGGVSTADTSGSQAADELPVDPTLPGCIFDSVIRLFNRTMPEFVTRCIDTDSQRQYLYHSIESDVRRQIERIASRARTYGATAAAGEATLPAAVADDVRRRERQLIADSERRRKAFEARIADLEAMLAKADAREAALIEENAQLRRRLRRSRIKPGEEEGQLSLF